MYIQAKNVLLNIIFLAACVLGSGYACATTWYVRDGGGTAAQCTGTTNAVYSGSGSGQACAFNNPRYALGWDTDHPQPGTMKGGDTLYIDGDSDISSGSQAQYLIGYDDSGTNETPDCSSSYPYDCILDNIPAGLSASQPTSIIGTGTHKPQLWGNERVWQVLDADNNYITLQWLEITDHQKCAYNDPVNGCNYNGPYPYGAWAEDGIYLGGTGLTLTDVYVHGIGRYGINTDNIGNITFTRLWVIGNGYAGFTTGPTATATGTLTFNQPIIEWNGCEEAYPMTSSGVDNSANYSECFGQANQGYGDGLAFGPTGNINAGNWTLIGPGSISFNTQDGLDTLHGNGNGIIQVDKMRFEGNAGQQVKANGENFSLTNSVVIADCGWWDGAAQSYSGFKLGDICRANGDGVLFNVTNSSTANIYNNTIVSNGSIAVESSDGESTGCNSSTAINFKNNIVDGGYWWGDDTAFNGAGGNTLTAFTYNDGNNGNGGGTCGTLKWNEDYNIVYNTKNTNGGCTGAHDKCGTIPGFSGTIPMGTAGGAANTYYQGTSAASLISLISSSAAIASGTAGLTYWNNENDYHNVTRTNPPSRGSLEASSCAANGYGCFFNSDCCAASCSNFVCGSSSSPLVSITSPSNGVSIASGSNITITASASESGGTISSVSFYNGGVLLGTDTTAPYSYVAEDVPAGIYTLTAKATDAKGVTVTSSVVSLTVTVSLEASPPVVNITSPINNSSVTVGSNVTITASASETGGTISLLTLYSSSGLSLDVGAGSSLSYVFSNIPAGTYTFYAIAVDLLGVSTTSSNVTITAKSSSSLPVVSITSPTNNSAFALGSTMTLSASASESGGTIASVSFYGNGSLIGTDTTAPYTLSHVNGGSGTFTLTAVATDTKGNSTTSSPVTITVGGAPVVSITSPTNNSTYALGSTMTISANASESDGTIANVAFYAGTSLLATDTTAPYTLSHVNGGSGTFTLTAVATDTKGNSTTSSPVTITVGGAPVVSITSPTNNSTYALGSTMTISANASESDGTIANVAFYAGTSLLATDTTAPYTLSHVNGGSGTFTLTAVATDTKGNSTTSSPVTITVGGAPVVSITSPTNNSTYALGSTMTISANASESDGTIANVAFYAGTSLLATDTTAPYTLSHVNGGSGTFTLTAVATDTKGNSTTSSPVTITVGGAPVVSITSPTNNSTYALGSTMTISANASESDGTIANVAFYAGTSLLATDTTAPYTLSHVNGGSGTFTLTAVATDTKGNSTTSSPVTITVGGAPVVSITSPTNNSTYALGSTMTISANASESDGTIANVAFYAGTSLLATDTTAPYTLSHVNGGSGTFTLTAVATDTKGNSTTSSPVTITVGGAPVVSITSPTNNSTYALGSTMTISANASESDGTIANVAFYAGTSLLATDTTAPYTLSHVNGGSGTFTLTAVATDTKGNSTTSSPVTITVGGAPVVSITSPTNNSTYALGSTMTISANASESDGTIANVAFYAGTSLLATDTTAPYTLSHVNGGSGTFTLTAVATDTKGNSTTSSPVTITVGGAPVVSITSPTNGATITAGSNVTITAAASETGGSIATVYFYNGSTLLGSDTSSPYTITVSGVPAGAYTLTAKAVDAKGNSTTSSSITVTATSAVAPTITTQPVSQTVTAPSTATFTVSASGTPTPSYQWKQEASGGSSFSTISGATSSSYTTPATTTSNSGTKYECVITNSAGSVTSNAATLTVKTEQIALF